MFTTTFTGQFLNALLIETEDNLPGSVVKTGKTESLKITLHCRTNPKSLGQPFILGWWHAVHYGGFPVRRVNKGALTTCKGCRFVGSCSRCPSSNWLAFRNPQTSVGRDPWLSGIARLVYSLFCCPQVATNHLTQVYPSELQRIRAYNWIQLTLAVVTKC